MQNSKLCDELLCVDRAEELTDLETVRDGHVNEHQSPGSNRISVLGAKRVNLPSKTSSASWDLPALLIRSGRPASATKRQVHPLSPCWSSIQVHILKFLLAAGNVMDFCCIVLCALMEIVMLDWDLIKCLWDCRLQLIKIG